jgi:hypothetical protein
MEYSDKITGEKEEKLKEAISERDQAWSGKSLIFLFREKY